MSIASTRIHEAAHAIAELVHGRAVHSITANANGGCCQPGHGDLPDLADVLIGDVGYTSEVIFFHSANPVASANDWQMATTAAAKVSGHTMERRRRNAEAFVWKYHAQIEWLANQLERSGDFLDAAAIGRLCHQVNSPLAEYASLYPATSRQSLSRRHHGWSGWIPLLAQALAGSHLSAGQRDPFQGWEWTDGTPVTLASVRKALGRR